MKKIIIAILCVVLVISVALIAGKYVKEDEKSIAIIGSRSCTEYGKKIAERFNAKLRITKDGKIVIYHDPTLERLTRLYENFGIASICCGDDKGFFVEVDHVIKYAIKKEA